MIAFLTPLQTVHAANPITQLQGIALLKIKSKLIDLELEQAVILNDNKTTFTGLDDFGGVVFTAHFDKNHMVLTSPQGDSFTVKNRKIKSLLSLPLNQEDFLSVLKYQLPAGFIKETKDSTEVWSDPKKKNLAIHFMNVFKTKNGTLYPKRILIVNRDNLFDLKWQKITLK